MLQYTFLERNGDAIITFKADSSEEAVTRLSEIVSNPDDWQIDDEDGEDC